MFIVLSIAVHTNFQSISPFRSRSHSSILVHLPLITPMHYLWHYNTIVLCKRENGNALFIICYMHHHILHINCACIVVRKKNLQIEYSFYDGNRF